MQSFVSQKVDAKMITISYWKVLTRNYVFYCAVIIFFINNIAKANIIRNYIRNADSVASKYGITRIFIKKECSRV